MPVTVLVTLLALKTSCGNAELDPPFQKNFLGVKKNVDQHFPLCMPKKECGTLESICDTNEITPTYRYHGKDLFTKSFAIKQKSAVGALKEKGFRPRCSGTLVSSNLFLTAKHCISDNLNTLEAVFNYDWYSFGSPTQIKKYKVLSIEELGEHIDYAVLRLQGRPGLKYGWTKISFKRIINAESIPIMIIHHPYGGRKQISTGKTASDIGFYINHTADTLAGSSGSGILNVRGEIFAMHTNGRCAPGKGYNMGIKLSKIPTSSILRKLQEAN